MPRQVTARIDNPSKVSQVCTYPTLFRPDALYADSGIRAPRWVSTARARPNSRPLARPRPPDGSPNRVLPGCRRYCWAP